MTKETLQYHKEIDIYGNKIIDISVSFIKGDVTEEERNKLYREAGENHLNFIKTEIAQLKEKI